MPLPAKTGSDTMTAPAPMTAPGPLVRLQGITQRYGDKTVLDNVSLDVERGAFTVLLGPSGSGKTTLLNILGGFLMPAAGHVSIDGRDVTAVPPAKRPTATVFQDYALFPTMTVGGNVGFGLRMRGVGSRQRNQMARDALAMVGLPDAYSRKPHQLSGGQRQRVALARSLVVEPLVLLLDEPLGALDLKLRRQMQDELKALQRRVGTTFVHVTHDQEEALAIADQIVVMNAGRIEDQGSPERIYLRPATRFTALFMGDSNIVDGTVLGQATGLMAVDTALGIFEIADANGRAIGTRVSLSLRPEHIMLTVLPANSRQIPGTATVTEISFLGTHTRIKLDAGMPLTVSAADAVGLVPGARVGLYIEPARLIPLRD